MGGRAWGAGLALLTLTSLVAEARPPDSERFWVEAKQQKTYAQASELSRVARKSLPAVVAITTVQSVGAISGGEEETGLGAGFVISPDGYILTSAHVIKGAREIRINLPRDQGGRELTAQLVGHDALTDVALLKVNAGRPLPYLALGTSDSLQIADWVVAIGNPFGLQHSVTVGVVSHKGRGDVSPGGMESEVDLIQTDASINPGSSGGPLLDLAGRVVGIANAVNVSGQGIGFAIPIEVAKAVLPQLRAHGEVRRGWLGVTVQDITPDLARVLGLSRSEGVLVSEVTAGGPAARAGLRVGDVIRRVDKDTLRRASMMRWGVGTRGIGRPIKLEFEREGNLLVRHVELETPPSGVGGSGPTEPDDSTSDAELTAGGQLSD